MNLLAAVPLVMRVAVPFEFAAAVPLIMRVAVPLKLPAAMPFEIAGRRAF